MLGNGITNVIAAAIIAAAILWTGGFGGDRGNGMTDEEFAAWYARAVGDIRNDIVISCGCCGDEGPRKAVTESF
jgi:hypothetical protein